METRHSSDLAGPLRPGTLDATSTTSRMPLIKQLLSCETDTIFNSQLLRPSRPLVTFLHYTAPAPRPSAHSLSPVKNSFHLIYRGSSCRIVAYSFPSGLGSMADLDSTEELHTLVASFSVQATLNAHVEQLDHHSSFHLSLRLTVCCSNRVVFDHFDYPNLPLSNPQD